VLILRLAAGNGALDVSYHNRVAGFIASPINMLRAKLLVNLNSSGVSLRTTSSP
jgi:hypothetical protein